MRKLEVECPLARPSSRWEDNVKIGLKKIEWQVVDSITIAQDGVLGWAVVNTVIEIRVL